MCFPEDSVKYATATCSVCAVMKALYSKPHTVCPHKPAMGVCRTSPNHPRGADIIYYRNAEIKTFNGCGYCKWADSHPELTQRERWENPGWPGCCRPPTSSEYRQYINGADWPAVSHIHKLSRASSDSAIKPQQPTSGTASSSSSSSSPMRDDTPIRPKQSPRSKPSSTWPVPRPHSPNRAIASQTRSSTDPIVRSSSPLSMGNSPRRERPSTPPIPSYQRDALSQQALRQSRAAGPQSAPKSGVVYEEPTTPPSRPNRELATPRRTAPSESSSIERTVTVTRESSLSSSRQRSSPVETEASTPRRTTIAIQTQSSFWPKAEDQSQMSTGSRSRIVPATPRQNSSPRSIEVPIASSDPRRRERNSTPPLTSTPPINDYNYVVTSSSRGNLTSEALARVHALDRALDGLTLTSSVPSVHPSPSWSSSSSSSSSGGSGSATSTSSRRDSSTTTGGSSDFTDFLSDDSDYELQRQAEERAAQLQKARAERADEREFRDAQESLAAVGLTESMGLEPAVNIHPGVSRQNTARLVQVPLNPGSGIPRGAVGMGAPRAPPSIPSSDSYQTVFVGRYN